MVLDPVSAMKGCRHIALFLTLGLAACSQHPPAHSDRSFSVYKNPHYQKALSELVRFNKAVVSDTVSHLVENEWIGVDIDSYELEDFTALRFYNPRYNSDSQEYRTQFDLLTPDYGIVSGEIGPDRSVQNYYRGAVQEAEHYHSGRCCFSYYDIGSSPYSSYGCYAVTPSAVEGRNVLLRFRPTDQGTFLELKFADATGNSFEPSIYFREKSKINSK